MAQIDVWGAFQRGQQIGRGIRDDQNRAAQGDAYAQGGWGAAQKMAGAQGDMEAAAGYGEQQRADVTQARQTAQMMGNVMRYVGQQPAGQRMQAWQAVAPRLAQMGVPQEQIAGVTENDLTDEAIGGFNAMFQGMDRFSEIRQSGNDIIGITPQGESVVIHQGQQNPPTGHTWVDPNNPAAGVSRLPGWEPPAQPAYWGQVQPGEAFGMQGVPFAQQSSRGEVRVPTGATQGLRVGMQMEARQRARLQTLYQQSVQNQNVATAIAQARQNVSRFSTGLAGQVLSNIGDTQANNLRANLATIVANIGFDRLQAMRDSSPTGGALGNVTERELSLLQQVVSSLDQSQTMDQFNTNLSRVERQYRNSMENIRAAYEQDFGPVPEGGISPGAVALPGGGADITIDINGNVVE